MGGETIWPTRPLKDCAVWYSGGTPNKATPRYWGGSIPWISARSLNDFFVSDSEDRVTEEGARNGTRLVPKDSILFIVRGMSLKSEFRMGIATRPVTFNQDLKALVAVDDVVPAYLAYAIRSKTTEILQMVGEAGHGTGVLPTDRIQALEIPVPSLEEQHAVAAILGALDAKIELNRKMNATLEAMARALFKSWFVDFDPVRAKAEGRAPWGMGAETAKLFPDEFVESDSKPIPKGWRYGSIGEFVELQRGTTYKSALKDLPGPVLLGLGAIQRNGGFRDDKLSTYGGDSPEKLLVYPGELFASLKDVTQSADLLGAVARVPRHVAGGRLTQDTVKLQLTGTIDIGEVVYRTLLTDECREYCRQHATGTTNLGLSREAFLSYPIVVAAAPVLDAFNRSIRSLSSRAEVAVIESRTLGRIRDELLPRLLSGELSVAHAEREVEAVA